MEKMEKRQGQTPANDDTAPLDFGVYSAFLAYQAPLPVSFIMAMQGLGRGPFAQSFTYAQAGLGDATALAVLADSYPEGEFIGIDADAGVIERGEALARAGGVPNMRLVQSTLEAADLPPCDIIALSGLYSSAEPEPRRRVVKAMAQRLKPGGALCVQYRSLPGAATTDMIFQLLREIAGSLEGDAPTRLKGALGRALELSRGGGFVFRQFPAAAEILERMSRSDPALGAREVFRSRTHALYASEVFREVEAAGLTYAGNGQVLGNLLELSIPPTLRASAEAVAAGAPRELFLDYARNNDARVDIFIRPDGKEPRETGEALADFLVRRHEMGPETLRRQQLAQNTGVDFTAQLYTDLLAAIKPTPQRIGDILEEPALRKHARARVVKAILLALGTDMASMVRTTVMPNRGPMPEKVRLTSKLNVHLIQAHLSTPDVVPISCPVTGQRLVLSLAQRLHLHALLGGALEPAYEGLAARGLQLTDKDGNEPTLEAFKASVMEELPAFRANDGQFLYAIGVLADARVQ
jgi:SAM-dependent methyltransferase